MRNLKKNFSEKRKDYFNGYYQSKNDLSPWAEIIFRETSRLLKFIVPPKSSVLDIGCGNGRHLAQLKTSSAKGVDFSVFAITRAKNENPQIDFIEADIEECDDLVGVFDYVILNNVIGDLFDVDHVLKKIRKNCTENTRLVTVYYNAIWDPIIRIATFLGMRKQHGPSRNWFSVPDIENTLYLAGYDVIESGGKLLMPLEIPFVTNFLNRYVSLMPGIRKLNLITYTIARLSPRSDISEHADSLSIIIPTRNEKGNIDSALRRMPDFPVIPEIIFVDGGSTDGTIDEINKVVDEFGQKMSITLIHQDLTADDLTSKTMLRKGKGDAVRLGFARAKGDILMILDSDLTVAPEDLPKFYSAVASGKAEFANGNRLSYPLEKDAMRFLNMVANYIFGLLFSWILGQKVKDTLCGTKVLTKNSYLKIMAHRDYFGDFDPFGDFDLLFGAAKLSLKIIDVPVRYYARTYGDIKIERFKHGCLLVKMCAIAFKRFKLQK